MERRAVTGEHHPFALRVAEENLAVGREVVGEVEGQLGAFTARRLERDHLAQLRLDAVLEHDVAPGLEREVVQRGLEREAPAVDGRGERQDRPLELAPHGPVRVEAGAPVAHASSRHSSTRTSRPAAPSSSSTVQVSSRTL